MADFVITVFHLSNERGFLAPPVKAQYHEQDSGSDWFIQGGPTRLYLVRFNQKGLDPDMSEQAAESHFMLRRMLASFTVGGWGAFRGELAGRFVMKNVVGNVGWGCDLGTSDHMASADEARLGGWLQAISTHTFLRRAAEDAYEALIHPHESLVFVYRGMEWIRTGLKISHDDLGALIGVPKTELRKLGQLANDETGVRHASKSGKKLRADNTIYSWVCGLLDAINAARAQLDTTFSPMTPQEVADAVLKAALEPFP